MLDKEELRKLDLYFNAANYLSAAQIYLKDNPILSRPLEFSDVKSKLVGHWGTVPGQNFIYMHLNRIIRKYDLNMIYVSGPGHGGNGMIANNYLDGTYTEFYPSITLDKDGLKKLFKQFSFPGGVSSHVAPETPGSIHEGGELGYSLSHSFGAVLDNPNLIVACVVGDGEAETGPLSGSWVLNKIINPLSDGVVVPILHLNGYKIANPTIYSRMSNEDLEMLFKGLSYKPYFVDVTDKSMDEANNLMADAMERVVRDIIRIKSNPDNVKWPMIIFRSLKGWTGPKEIDGKAIEGSFRAHQVPIEVNDKHPESLKRLEDWLRSYKPEEIFNELGEINPDIKDVAPQGNRRMGANPHANGGLLLEELNMPNFREYGVKFEKRGELLAQDMTILGKYMKDVVALNSNPRNYRIFGPDEALSNRLNDVFLKTNRQWNSKILKNDEFLAIDGSVIDSVLSEHACEGLLEGYLLTGRHGVFHSYEAFIRIVDSMASQHAKWLKVCQDIPWRQDISSLNFILASHVWQQDHNGYTHQDPGFLNHVVTKKASVVRAYLPPDANCLISCYEHVTKSKNYLNVIIASKHPHPQWLNMDEAIIHCTKGLGIWPFACTDRFKEPDIVIAAAGDVPTLEALAATTILRKFFKDLKIRFVNVVDLMRLQPEDTHPHGLSDEDYDMLFTKDKPIVFAFHGYPNLIHELTYKRHNKNLHVRGYQEEGTITTPFDMRVQNKIDRYSLTILALKHLPDLGDKRIEAINYCENMLIHHKEFIREYGRDIDEVVNWKWEDVKDKNSIYY